MLKNKFATVWSVLSAFLMVMFLGAWLPTCNEAGALIDVTVDDVKVGVLLDEIPEGPVREAVAAQLLAKPTTFWEERANRQLEYWHYRGIYTAVFYPDEDPNTPNGSLPFPPQEIWDIDLGSAAQRGDIDGHDYVYVTYDFKSTLLTCKDCPQEVLPVLGSVGGQWEELLVAPADPELLLQRTGNSCVDEFAYPPNGYDEENVWLFYDQECQGDSGTPWCHLTPASSDCLDALDEFVGRSELIIKYKRKQWSKSKANSVRVQDLPLTPGADLIVSTGELGLDTNRLVYRWFETDACEVEEGCIGGTGWRRLLMFTSIDHNIGGDALVAGTVSEVLPEYNWFHYNECHAHYHFEHYGSFGFSSQSGAGTGSKLSFCLESTNRLSNNEATPLYTQYQGCDVQGIERGFGDQYQAGLPCQWVDVTDVPDDSLVAGFLFADANPDDLMCEGLVSRDGNGDLVWVESPIVDDHGDPIYQPECTMAPDCQDGTCDTGATYDAFANNRGEVPVELPVGGNTFVTEDCVRGQVGPLRDCGFEYHGAFDCAAGAQVTYNATLSGQALPVLRVCQKSDDLGVGVGCTMRDSVAQVTASSVTFECPEMLDGDAPGEGGYSVYLGDGGVVN